MKEHKKYLNLLQKKNGYCPCKEMQELYNFRRIAERKIREESIGVGDSIRIYDAKLTSWVNRGRLELLLHNPETGEAKKIFPFDIKEDKVITANCPTCHNQIDVISQ